MSESAQDSSFVGQVEAIDNDTGPDGEVFYYFVGASNNAGFQIDKRTGIITVKGNLDRESQNRYVLTVLAKNKGSIKGKDFVSFSTTLNVFLTASSLRGACRPFEG